MVSHVEHCSYKRPFIPEDLSSLVLHRLLKLLCDNNLNQLYLNFAK